MMNSSNGVRDGVLRAACGKVEGMLPARLSPKTFGAKTERTIHIAGYQYQK